MVAYNCKFDQRFAQSAPYFGLPLSPAGETPTGRTAEDGYASLRDCAPTAVLRLSCGL